MPQGNRLSRESAFNPRNWPRMLRYMRHPDRKVDAIHVGLVVMCWAFARLFARLVWHPCDYWLAQPSEFGVFVLLWWTAWSHIERWILGQ